MKNTRPDFVVLLVFAALAATVGCGGAPEEPDGEGAATHPELAAEIDAYLGPVIANHDFSGVILIGSRDEVLYRRAHGMADVDNSVPNALDTRFAIASLTKTLTAAATLIAKEQGLLELSDTLDRFGLDFPRANEITVRQLLTHSSGLANPSYAEAFTATIEPGELVERIAAQPLLFDPGSENRYSNAGFNVLAWVVAQAAGVSYEDFLRGEIFDPLGMAASGHLANDAPGVAVGHIPGPGPQWTYSTPPIDLTFSYGSGSLRSTAPDLLLWARAVGDERLVAWRELEWPYGWGKVQTGTHEGIEQTGGMTGFMSNLLVYPDDGLFVIVLANQEYGDWIGLGRDLAAIVLGEPYQVREPRATAALSDEERAQCTGRYADGEQAIEIVDHEGHLWLHTPGWPVGKYLAPVSAGQFVIPSDVGRITFRGGSADAFGELHWDFGGPARVYRREAQSGG